MNIIKNVFWMEARRFAFRNSCEPSLDCPCIFWFARGERERWTERCRDEVIGEREDRAARACTPVRKNPHSSSFCPLGWALRRRPLSMLFVQSADACTLSPCFPPFAVQQSEKRETEETWIRERNRARVRVAESGRGAPPETKLRPPRRACAHVPPRRIVPPTLRDRLPVTSWPLDAKLPITTTFVSRHPTAKDYAPPTGTVNTPRDNVLPRPGLLLLAGKPLSSLLFTRAPLLKRSFCNSPIQIGVFI